MFCKFHKDCIQVFVSFVALASEVLPKVLFFPEIIMNNPLAPVCIRYNYRFSDLQLFS